jgi:hypothetical protein
MTKLRIVFLVLGFMCLGACATLRQVTQGDANQKPSSPVTTVPGPELRPGLLPREVKAILGEPDDLMIISGAGASERWKYYHPAEGGLTPNSDASITELVFVEGRLQKWATQKRRPREADQNKY